MAEFRDEPATERQDPGGSGAGQEDLRKHLSVPADDRALVRVVRLPLGGRVHPFAPGLPRGDGAGTSDVPDGEQHSGQQLQLGFLRGVVPNQDQRLLPAAIRHRPEERH